MLRINNNSLFPRNNLIDGNGQEGSSSSNLNGGGKLSSTHLDNSNGGGTQDGSQKNGGVRICQLKDMRRQAFVQEQLEFVGKLTSQQ